MKYWAKIFEERKLLGKAAEIKILFSLFCMYLEDFYLPASLKPKIFSIWKAKIINMIKDSNSPIIKLPSYAKTSFC